jgi:G6PDH family F420-dependent oxidoreductase
MVELGYTLSSEELPPEELVRLARRAEEVGFSFAMIPDHFHPWTSRQGQSPFVWSVLGAVARETRQLRVGTAVTCPIRRMHPAIVAHAAATTARLFGGRFSLGLGSGENLNEHIVGEAWPEPERRIQMLREAIEVIRALWEGETVTHRGEHFTVDQARLFTLPEQPPPILVAASGSTSAELAGEAGDGLVAVAPSADLVEAFVEAGGSERPRYGQLTCCYGANEDEARRNALAAWPNSGLPGDLSWETKTVELFDEATQLVRTEDIDSIVCGADPDRFVEGIRKFEKAGFDHVWLHQVGAEQDAFLDFCELELLTRT